MSEYELYPLPTFSITIPGNVYNPKEKQVITGSIGLQVFEDIADYNGLQVAKDGWWEVYEWIMNEHEKIFGKSMKFKVEFASGNNGTEEMEINSLEELRDLAEKYKCGLILKFANDFGGKYIPYITPYITIYDDYVE